MPVADDSGQAVGVVICAACGAEGTTVTREILHGLEEEGVPYMIESRLCKTVSPVEMAYQAAGRSVFGVGICSSENGIVLHCLNLPKEKPVFVIQKHECCLNEARLIGVNAARLVKGAPLEEI